MTERPEKPLTIDEFEIVYAYDLLRSVYTAELTLKEAPTKAELLKVCLPDSENKDELGATFIEGANTDVDPELLVMLIAKLEEWRDETGDHLGIHALR